MGGGGLSVSWVMVYQGRWRFFRLLVNDLSWVVVGCLSPVLWCIKEGTGLFVSWVMVYHGWWWLVCLLGNGVPGKVVVCLTLG